MTDKISNKFFIITICLLTIALIYTLSTILVPFMIAAILAYLCDPLVHRLMRLRLSRLSAVIIVFAFLFSIIIVFVLSIIPLIQAQISILIEQIPDMILWVKNFIAPFLPQFLGVSPDANIVEIKNAIAKNLIKNDNTAEFFLHTAFSSGKKLLEFLMNLILIPVVTFYFLRDWDRILNNICNIIPKKYVTRTIKIAKECDDVLSAFLRGQLIVMLVLGIYYATALTLIGLKIGVIIGVIIGIVTIIPYLGFLVGIVLASISTVIQFGSFLPLIWIAIIFLIGNVLENLILVPVLVGDRIGLHSVAVIFAILVGGTLFGFFGVLLALPVASVIMVIMRHLYHHYYCKIAHTSAAK